MITSSNLCAIPFLGHCDNSRLQMSAKQLSQAVTSLHCEVAKVVSENYLYLSNGTRMFKYIAPTDGEILFVNNEIMLVNFHSLGNISFEILEIPVVRSCSGLYSTCLRYRRDVGSFKSGDILYEYDAFIQNIPAYGRNFLTAYMPFFGLNHEDSLVISETVADKCRSVKSEIIVLPIYTYSMFKMVYNEENSFGFIPGIGQHLSEDVLAYRIQLKNSRDTARQLKYLNATDLLSVIDNNFVFNTIPITTRIKNARVMDLRVHKIHNQAKTLIDKKLQIMIDKLRQNYGSKVLETVTQLRTFLSKNTIEEILQKHYILSNKIEMKGLDKEELLYLIEISIANETPTSLGDKLVNRYANKGVTSLILPDELRPIAMNTGEPINIINGPISVN